jgi:hypothetical protein
LSRVIELVEITVAVGLDKLGHPVRSSTTPADSTASAASTASAVSTALRRKHPTRRVSARIRPRG